MPRARTDLLAMAAAAAAASTATPAAACTVTTTPVAFGAYSVLAVTPLDGVGEVTLRCPPNTSNPQVAVSAGSSGTFLFRTLTQGPHQLRYNLYTSAARLIVLGDGTGGSATITASGGTVSGGTRTFSVPIYGRIPPLQLAGEGAYGDSLFVTVTF